MLSTSRTVAALAVLALAAGAGTALAQAPLPVAFDLIVSSGSGTPNGLTVPAPLIEPGDNPGNVFRFDGQTGEFRGFLIEEGDNGLLDPRDLVIAGPLFGRPTFLVVNTAGFNNPNAIPPGGTLEQDAVFVYNLRGRFLGKLIDFNRVLPDTPISPGGGVFGPTTDPNDPADRLNYFVGSRAQGDVYEIDARNGQLVGPVPGTGDIAFPRGFVFTEDGTLFIGSGSNPSGGGGDDAILKVNPVTGETEVFFSSADLPQPDDPNAEPFSFSPLDVVLSPGGTALITTSESPFSPGVETASQVLIIPLDFDSPDDIIVLDPNTDPDNPILVDPRGIGIGPDGLLYVSSAGNDTILRFDPFTGAFIDVFATAPGLNGQALNFIPKLGRRGKGRRY